MIKLIASVILAVTLFSGSVYAGPCGPRGCSPRVSHSNGGLDLSAGRKMSGSVYRSNQTRKARVFGNRGCNCR